MAKTALGLFENSELADEVVRDLEPQASFERTSAF
jgi:hypothetical protein